MRPAFYLRLATRTAHAACAKPADARQRIHEVAGSESLGAPLPPSSEVSRIAACISIRTGVGQCVPVTAMQTVCKHRRGGVMPSRREGRISVSLSLCRAIIMSFAMQGHELSGQNIRGHSANAEPPSFFEPTELDKNLPLPRLVGPRGLQQNKGMQPCIQTEDFLEPTISLKTFC